MKFPGRAQVSGDMPGVGMVNQQIERHTNGSIHMIFTQIARSLE